MYRKLLVGFASGSFFVHQRMDRYRERRAPNGFENGDHGWVAEWRLTRGPKPIADGKPTKVGLGFLGLMPGAAKAPSTANRN